MEKQMHRLLSFMLSLILVVGLIPGTALTAFAAEPAKITSVVLTGAPESYTVGEELGTLTSPGGVGEGIAIEGYMMVESDMSSFHYYAVTPMSPTSTFKADKYYYYVVMIDCVDDYAFTDSTIYTINGKTAKAEWFAADENNCTLCVVPYDKTTGQLKNYDCPIAVPNGFTAIDSVDISGVPESFTPGDVIDVDLKGDSFTVSNPHAILETDRDWYVDWYKFDSDTFGFYEFLDSTSHAVVSNQTFSGDKYYYIGIILTADVENGYMFTENTTFTINGKTAAWSMYATAGFYAYVFAAVPKASAEYSVEVALNGYSLGAKVEDAYVFENSDTVDLYDFNDDGTFFCIFEDDGTGCSDWSSVVTTFEANKDYWLVIALTKQNGDALPETELDADNFKLINGCADKYTVFDDDLWWVEFKLNRLSDAAPSVYNITFDANGGSVTPVSATTANDGKLTSLPTPTHTSPYMTFDGWYTGKTGDTKVTADTVYTSDTTIYARWNADYAIEVTLNGYEPGKNVADTTLSENSDTVDIDRENCHIFTEKDGAPDWNSEVTAFEANKDYWLVVALTKQGGDELTYADLTADDVDLTNDYTAELIDYDDGLWWVSYKLKPLENSVSTTTVIEELHISGVTMPVVGAMPINFATTSTPGVTIGEDIFWVRYVPETNDLTDLYDDNTYVDNTPFRSGVKYFLQVILEPQNGYTIATDAKIFYNGIQLPMPDASLSQSCATVHPEGTMAMALIGGEVSVPTTYTVTFDSDGGSAVTAQTVEGGKTVNKPDDPTKEGYTFRGWYLAETEYDFETPVGGDITLKAKWEVIPTASFIDEIHISGVTMPVVGAMPINFATTSTPGVTIGEDIFWVRYVPETNNLTDLYDDNTYVDNTPFRSGVKYFLQVILEPQNGCTIATDAKIFYNGIQLPMPDASLSQSCATVHPEGTMAMALISGETSVPTYTVTFDSDGGSAVAAQNVESGKTASKPTDPIKEGYTFMGWYLGETEYDFETPVSGDITLKAKWEAVVEEPKHTCDIKPVAKDEPSCTEGGKEAYYKCEDCGKFYEDALGAKEITDINAWGNLPKLDHTESDWMSDKDNHWKECTVTACGVILENSKAAHKDNNKDGKCDVCEYNVGISGGSSEDDKPSDNPQTGDNNMMWLWIALLFVGSAGITATTIAEKKKLSVK